MHGRCPPVDDDGQGLAPLPPNHWRPHCAQALVTNRHACSWRYASYGGQFRWETTAKLVQGRPGAGGATRE